MKLEETKIYITRLEDGIDKDGNAFLKAKGYNTYGKGKTKGFNFFSNIKLYPVSQEQMDSTKERLFSQTEDKPKIQIVAYQSDVVTPLNNGKILVNLVCYRYDFVTRKLYTKSKLLNYGKENKNDRISQN